MKKKVNEGLEMDMTTYKKVKGTLDPKTPIKITGDKPSAITSQITEETPEAVIEPQDNTTIKYLSNIKAEDGQVSKPFTIDGKNYQMVRGVNGSKEVVMGVYCHDDLNEGGENLIHDVKYFEENIANPAKIKASQEIPLVKKEIASIPKEENKADQSLKLSEFKHFVIDSKTGKVRKFKRADELAKANMTETEKYMNLQQFKKHVDETLFGTKQRKNEAVSVGGNEEGVNVDDLQSDVKKFVTIIKDRLGKPLDKINTDIKRAAFLSAIAELVGVPSNKIGAIMSTFKEIAKTAEDNVTTESKILTKNDLIESVKIRKPNKIIKIKDIK